MGDGEAIIHLKKPRGTTISVCVPQDHLDGLNQLLHFVQALQKHGGQGRVPGYFELVMHYRTLRRAVDKAERVAEVDLPKCDVCGRICTAPNKAELPEGGTITWCGGMDCAATVAVRTPKAPKRSMDDENPLLY